MSQPECCTCFQSAPCGWCMLKAECQACGDLFQRESESSEEDVCPACVESNEELTEAVYGKN